MEPFVLQNFEQLCAPIKDDAPTGIDSREDEQDTLYREIRDARKQARDIERKSLFDDDQTPQQALALWETVKAFSIKLLTQQSKDLDVMAWLIESLTRLHGFAGLSDGFKLTVYYLEHYWDNLYPEPDEDGLETKVAAFIGLNGSDGEGTLMQPIRSIPLNVESCDLHFAYWQYQQASDLEKITDSEERKARTDQLGMDIDDIERNVRFSTSTEYDQLYQHISSALEHYQQMTELFDKYCGYDSPPSSNIKNVLQQVKTCIEKVAQLHLAVNANADDSEQSDNDDNSQDQVSTDNTSNTVTPKKAENLTDQAIQSIKNREQALRQLQEIADFFLKTEPHSPISYSVSQSVRWARMPLNELILELLPDEDARESFASKTGVELPEEDDE